MSTDSPVLYGYWRSTAAYRVRIALALKGIAYRNASVHLVRDGGQQHGTQFQALNPAGLVPALVIDGQVLVPVPGYLRVPGRNPPAATIVALRAAAEGHGAGIALDIACDLHPLNNLRVQQYLRGPMQQPDAELDAWMAHWMRIGFRAIETRLAQAGCQGRYCVGDSPGIADICLVAQAYNADRFNFDLTPYPLALAVIRHCRTLPAFQAAVPEAQPDAPAS